MQDPAEKSDFEKFDGVKKTHAPKVSIRKNAQIAISTGAVREYGFRDKNGERNYKYFLLFWSQKRKQIGLKPTNEKQDAVVKARDHSSGEIQLAAQSFLDHYKIPYNETRRFPLEYEEDKDLYVIDLAGIKDRIGEE